MKHFDSFGKTRKQICEIDDELCHYTEASGWDVRYYLYLHYFIVALSVSVSLLSFPLSNLLSLYMSPSPSPSLSLSLSPSPSLSLSLYPFGHKLKVWPVGPEQNLELEWTKKIIEYDSLNSSDGAGINEHISFTSMDTFSTFWEWLSPN